MTTLRRSLLVLSLALVAAPVSAAGAAGDLPPEATFAAPTPVAAYAGHMVFSRRAAAGRYVLVERVGAGPERPLPVASRAVPFDVDVGPTSGGRILAVYTRCATEPPPVLSFPGLPVYQTGKGCDVYKVDLDGGREHRFTAANASDATEFWPTYWKGRLGFARVYDHKPDYPYLYVKTIVSGHASQRMPGGQRKECSSAPGQQPPCSDDRRSRPEQLELYGDRLAFAWSYQGLSEGTESELRLDTVGGGHRRLDHASGGSLTALIIGWPAFEGGRLFWSRACFGDEEGCPGRARLVKSTYTGTIVELEAHAPYRILSHERDRLATTLLTDSSGLGDCQADPPKAQGTCSLTVTRPDYRPRH